MGARSLLQPLFVQVAVLLVRWQRQESGPLPLTRGYATGIGLGPPGDPAEPILHCYGANSLRKAHVLPVICCSAGIDLGR